MELPKLANKNINLKFLEKATRNEFYDQLVKMLDLKAWE